MFIDTHCHLYAEEFDEDRAEVVARALEAGADKILLPNIDANTVGPMLAVCDEWHELCHPMMDCIPRSSPLIPLHYSTRWSVCSWSRAILSSPLAKWA